MHPAVNLILAAAIAVLAYLFFRVRRGWFWRWLKRGVDPQRVRMEDSLKHLFHCEEAEQAGSLDSLAGALGIPRSIAMQLVASLQSHGLATVAGTKIELTDEGRRYALQVIRTHRLWEQYLAEETGLDESEWHEQAEHREHELTPADADRLAAQMGNPLYDPHGDPIPTESGLVPPMAGRPLNEIAPGHAARIVHIEDEPESVYRTLRRNGLRLGLVVAVQEQDGAQVKLDLQPGQCVLSSFEAANVSVELLAAVPPRPAGHPMSELDIGGEAVVDRILPSCHGIERRRLLDLGLVPGTAVTAEFRSPAGDPTAYRIRGTLIALRRQQAEKIIVISPSA